MFGVVDDALAFFYKKNFECAVTLSPLDRPSDLSPRLEQRGFTLTTQGAAMVCDQIVKPRPADRVTVEELDPAQTDLWIDILCRGFGLQPEVGDLAKDVLDDSKIRRFLALVDGEPAGTALLYSQFAMGYVDLVGTLPQFRRLGVASCLVARAVAESQAIGNRWTALETTSESAAERIYKRLGFRVVYHRPRYVKPTR